MSYSFFNADVVCPSCGRSVLASFTSKVEADPGAVFQVGSTLEVTPADMDISHYRVRAPRGGEPLRFLETWSCGTCGSAEWAEIVVDNDKVVSIDVVPFDAATLDRVHYVSDGLFNEYAEVTGEPLFVDEAIRPDWPQRLRAHLEQRQQGAVRT